MTIPSVIHLGPIPIHMYGLFIGMGIIAGAKVAERVLLLSQGRESKSSQHSITSDDLWNVVVVSLVAGIIGARAYHVIDQWHYYANNLDKVMAVWNGGLGIYGAMLGAVIGVFGLAFVQV